LGGEIWRWGRIPTVTTAPPLVLQRVRYRYAGTGSLALTGVDLVLEGGQVTALLGPNEAGKTTLCLVASGLAPLVVGGRLEGEVQLEGAATTSLRPHQLAERCGILFQDPLTQLSGTAPTVWEEVAFGPRNLGLPRGVVVERVEEALRLLGIHDLAPRDPTRLSGGQAQLVALASVLSLRPRCLVLDEPTSQLDAAGTALVGRALAVLGEETSAAVLLVEHRTDLVGQIARQTLLLDGGAIRIRGSAREVLARDDLLRLGVTPPADVRLRRALAPLLTEPTTTDEGQGDLAALLASPPSWSLAVGTSPSPSPTPAGPAAEGSHGGWRGGALPPASSRPVPSGRPGIVGRRRATVPEIVFDHVSFRYPDGTAALHGIDLSIPPGSGVAIVGENGSGKSTLVRHLVGLLRPTQGRVLVGGRDAAGLRVAQLAALVGVAFQHPDRQIFSGRVRTEVAFGPRNLGLRGEDLTAAVEGALEAVGLAAVADVNPYDLGYSRRKLLALASILAMETPVVVLDEPTTGQDAPGIARLEEIVGRLLAEGRTVIAVSHDLAFVARTFPRMIVMGGGRILLDGPTTEVLARPHWAVLAAAHVEPPLPVRIGELLGVGATPSEAALAEALLRQRSAPRR
jgi:energy-coupling factor transporter ATP-binding protein EcfA2